MSSTRTEHTQLDAPWRVHRTETDTSPSIRRYDLEVRAGSDLIAVVKAGDTGREEAAANAALIAAAPDLLERALLACTTKVDADMGMDAEPHENAMLALWEAVMAARSEHDWYEKVLEREGLTDAALATQTPEAGSDDA